ncbi:MAG: TolC family protein [Planctomycetes bacterium]|nr:TolC family protein [Planctomycetota bacterium]
MAVESPNLCSKPPERLLRQFARFALLAAIVMSATGCGLTNWWRTQRQIRLDTHTEPVFLESYSREPPNEAAPEILQQIQDVSKPPPRLKPIAPVPLPDDASAAKPSKVIPASAETQGPEPSPSVAYDPSAEPQPTAGEQIDVGGVGSAPIGARQAMTLEDVRVAALLGNLDLQVVKYNPPIQEQAVRQEAWKFESTFQGLVQRSGLSPPPSLPLDPSQAALPGYPSLASLYGAPPPLATEYFNPGLNIPFTTGGTLILSEAISKRNYNIGGPSPSFYDLAPTLTLTQPLLRGAGVYVNTAPIKFAQLQLGRVDALTKLTAIQVLAATEEAYWNLYGSQKFLEIALQQVDLATEQLEIAKRLYRDGVVTKADVLRSESGLLLRKQNVVTARLQVKLANRQLKQIIQAPDAQVDTTLEIEPISIPNLIGLTLDRDGLGDKAISNRLELVDLALQLDQNRLTANVARNQILPKVDFVFQGQLLGLGTSFSQTSSQAWDGSGNSFFTGLTFSQGLAMNQTARANYTQACLTLARTAAQQQQTRIAILKETNDAVDRFEQNWQGIRVAQASVAATTATFTAEQRLFTLGQRTSDLVLIAAANLATAQQQLVQAVVNYQVSRVGIAFATGTVLGYASLEPVMPTPADQPAETTGQPADALPLKNLPVE